MKKKANKHTNPLYVVTQKGNVVEEAQNYFELLLKKFDLVPLWEMVISLWNELLSQAKSYPMLQVLIDYLNLMIAKLRLWSNYSIG